MSSSQRHPQDILLWWWSCCSRKISLRTRPNSAKKWVDHGAHRGTERKAVVWTPPSRMPYPPGSRKWLHSHTTCCQGWIWRGRSLNPWKNFHRKVGAKVYYDGKRRGLRPNAGFTLSLRALIEIFNALRMRRDMRECWHSLSCVRAMRQSWQVQLQGKSQGSRELAK